jgi:P pilus assembly chaperone PapD
MNNFKTMSGVVAASVMAVAGSASAGTIAASFSASHSQGINIDAPGHYVGNVTTVTFNWTRSDSPGAGVDSILPSTFNTWCIDLDQSVSAGVNHTYNAMTGADYGLSGTQITLLSRLFGKYGGGVDNATKSAAFQAAVWEIRYDTDNALTTSTFKLNTAGNIRTLAQSWLDDVASANYTGGTMDIYVLQSNTVQDQVAAVVPTPGAGLLLAAAGLLAMPRRRN